jgi:hypothetical protein
MKNNDFQVLIRNTFYRSTHVMGRKSKEYASDDEKLANFKKAAALQGLRPEQALFGMLAKHLVSLADMAGDQGGTPFPREVWEEKLTDAINYLLLLEAVIHEKDNWVDQP